MHKVAQLSDTERSELFNETAARMDTIAAIVEKDFWVVWVLDKLFSHKTLNTILQFKGGTSLSKVYDVIGRFSEDIDLVLDWREVIHDDPYKERSNTQKDKFNTATNEQAIVYIEQTLLPIISKLVSPLCGCNMDQNNPFAIVVTYPRLNTVEYLRPEILLEIGPLASWTPSDTFSVRSYAADYFPDLFVQASCDVPTILGKRTFWEKATILHQEAHRKMDKVMPERYSRHYYDLALLAQSEIKQEALADLDLLNEVVEFKQRFYPNNWAQYDLAKSGSLKLVPSDDRIKEIAEDYEKMQLMIFRKRISLDEIINTLDELEKEINSKG